MTFYILKCIFLFCLQLDCVCLWFFWIDSALASGMERGKGTKKQLPCSYFHKPGKRLVNLYKVFRPEWQVLQTQHSGGGDRRIEKFNKTWATWLVQAIWSMYTAWCCLRETNKSILEHKMHQVPWKSILVVNLGHSGLPRTVSKNAGAGISPCSGDHFWLV